MKFNLSRHAEWEIVRRRIPRELLESVLRDPQQKIAQSHGKCIYQSLVEFAGGGTYLLRVVVAEDRDPPLVITVYRTSKINKYWRPK